MRFELAAPVRVLRSRRGQRHLPGRWWSATEAAMWGMGPDTRGDPHRPLRWTCKNTRELSDS